MDFEDNNTDVAATVVLKQVHQKRKLHAKMKDLKQKINTRDEIQKKQKQLQNQFKNIEQSNQRNWKKQTSYGNSIDYLAESPILRSKMKQIEEYNNNQRNKKNKKTFFSKSCCKKATDLLKGSSLHKNFLNKEMNQHLPLIQTQGIVLALLLFQV